jgi:hypothetical protein
MLDLGHRQIVSRNGGTAPVRPVDPQFREIFGSPMPYGNFVRRFGMRAAAAAELSRLHLPRKHMRNGRQGTAIRLRSAFFREGTS